MYNGTVCRDDNQECGQSVDFDRAAPPDEWHGEYQGAWPPIVERGSSAAATLLCSGR